MDQRAWFTANEVERMELVPKVLLLSYYVIMGAGVYACWRAYRHRRNRAWLLLTIYCLLPFVTYGSSVVGRLLYGPIPPKVVVQQDELMSAGQKAPVQRIEVRLPIGPVILLIALWSLAKKELEEESVEPVPDGEENAGGTGLPCS